MLDVTVVKGKKVTEFCIPGTWEDAVQIINGNSNIKIGQVKTMRYLQLNNILISEPDEDEEKEFPTLNLTIQQVLDM